MRFLTLGLILCLTLSFFACEEGGQQITPLGNRYELFKTGSGDLVQSGDYVYFHAALRTEGDSTLFSTRESGGEMPVIQAAPDSITQIGPVEDVLRYMRIGDSATVRVNISDNPQRPPGMENDTVIIYDVVVEKILSAEEFEADAASKQAEAEAERELTRSRGDERRAFAAGILEAYNAGSLEGVQTTETGLKYVIHEAGTGPQAMPGKGVTVQYIGQLVSDGNIFDQSFERGMGIPFQLGARQVIPGWDEGIALLKEGAKATFFIPSDLAYGAQGTPDGSIPAGAELAFYVELEKVQ